MHAWLAMLHLGLSTTRSLCYLYSVHVGDEVALSYNFLAVFIPGGRPVHRCAEDSEQD